MKRKIVKRVYTKRAEVSEPEIVRTVTERLEAATYAYEKAIRALIAKL